MSLDPARSFPRRPRLKKFDYIGTYKYFITILSYGRKEYFSSDEIVKEVLHVLKESVKADFDMLVYCFMPDHIHLLLSGKSEISALKKTMKDFKQKSGFLFSKKYNKKLWHISYHDHVLRSDEDVLEIARYILNNPVRKKLVSRFNEYPFAGSMKYDINNL